MSETSRNIAVIGAGPASLYASEELAKAGHQVVILNRDIKPGGLAEFGIYPTKYRMKTGLRNYFNRILERENVHYFGNVTVGDEGSISLDEVRDLGFDALVVAVGAQGTKWLGLPGEEAAAVFHAKDLVYHYNGLPPFSEREFPVGDHVAVVGLGNVAMDIVHWMVCEKGVDSVTAVARRGPKERKFTRKEYRLVSGALDTDDLRAELERVAPVMESLGQDVETEEKALFRFVDKPLEKDSTTAFRMRFLLSPARIEVDDDGQVTGLVCERTTLTPPREGSDRVGVERLGEFFTLPCDTVVFAIGDAIEPSIGLPLDPEWGDSFATVPEPWAANPDRPRYMVYDPATDKPLWDTFVVGWARKASDGLVGKARADSVQGCDEILAYLEGELEVGPSDEPRAADEVLGKIEGLLEDRQVRAVNYQEVCRIVDWECAQAEEQGVQEYKICERAAMLKLLDERQKASAGA